VSDADAEACAPGGSFWERHVVSWHAVFAGVAAVTVLLALVDGLRGPRLGAYALLAAASVGWYWWAGRPVLGYQDDRRGALYAAGAVLLLAGMGLLSSYAFFLLFVLFPQMFAMLSLRGAIVASGALAAVIAVVPLAGSDLTGPDIARAVAAGLVNLTLASLLGLWISGLVRESMHRAELLDELRHTRDELAAAHHEAGVLAERERLSREIHDTLAQGFTSMLMLAQAADATLDDDPAATRARLHSLERTARENLDEARSLVAALSPVDLQHASLVSAVERVAAGTEQDLGVPVAFTVDGDPRPLTPRTEVVLLRAAQEALANVRKHADAGRVSVCLAYRDEATRLVVADDGRGFDPGLLDGQSRGFGLRGMQARATQAGGSLDVTSRCPGGTTVRVEVP